MSFTIYTEGGGADINVRERRISSDGYCPPITQFIKNQCKTIQSSKSPKILKKYILYSLYILVQPEWALMSNIYGDDVDNLLSS